MVVRKSYGVAHYAMCGIGMENDLLCAWPSAEISFMEPETAANVLKPKVASDDPEDRRAFAAEIAAEITPYGAAGSMRIDEIDPPQLDTLRPSLRARRRLHPPVRTGQRAAPRRWPPPGSHIEAVRGKEGPAKSRQTMPLTSAYVVHLARSRGREDRSRRGDGRMGS